MSARIGLYEFLACDVALTTGDTGVGGGTSLTATSTETYDDDPGVERLGDMTSLGTETRAAIAEYEHRRRANRVRVPDHVLETTVITRVVGETHDDDGASLQFDA